jgi:hypothetical protein
MKVRLILRLLFIVSFSLGLGQPAMDVQAATCTWTGTVSTDWNTIGNWSGCINLGDGSLNPGETLALEAGALLVGSGTLSSNLVNGGTDSPGASPGIITVDGNYTQESGGILEIELGGDQAGSGVVKHIPLKMSRMVHTSSMHSWM